MDVNEHERQINWIHVQCFSMCRLFYDTNHVIDVGKYLTLSNQKGCIHSWIRIKFITGVIGCRENNYSKIL